MSPTLVTGNVVSIQGVGGFTGANGQWTITVIDSTHIDLQGSNSTPPTLTGTDTSGNLVIQALSSVANVAVGQNISGTGIPASTTVSAFSPVTGELVLSALATSTNAATTLTITNSAYTSGGTVVLDTDARTGDAFTFTNSEALSCVSCFQYDHTIGFHVGTAAKWTKLINPDSDGQNIAEKPEWHCLSGGRHLGRHAHRRRNSSEHLQRPGSELVWCGHYQVHEYDAERLHQLIWHRSHSGWTGNIQYFRNCGWQPAVRHDWLCPLHGQQRQQQPCLHGSLIPSRPFVWRTWSAVRRRRARHWSLMG